MKILSEINSCRTAGLLIFSFAMHAAYLMLKWDILRVVVGVVGIGPGFSSISPASRRRKKKKDVNLLVLLKWSGTWDRFRTEPNGTLSRYLQTDENGKGW